MGGLGYILDIKKQGFFSQVHNKIEKELWRAIYFF